MATRPDHDARTVLVTGAAGFIGLPLVERLRVAGFRVLAVDNDAAATLPRLSKSRSDSLVSVHALDICDPAAMRELVARERPDAVAHLAARHFVPSCDTAPIETLAVNVLGTQSLVDACYASPPKKIVFASTGAVYGAADAPLGEDSPLGPAGVYGCSKLAAEWLIREQLGQQAGCAVVVARLFNVYGPGDPNPHLIPEIVDQARRGEIVRLGDLSTARDFVHVDDVVEALFAMLTAAPPGAYNVGTGHSTTGREVVDLVRRLTRRPLTVSLDRDRLRSSCRPYLCADPSKLRGLLPWWPRMNLVDGLSGMLAEQPRVAAVPSSANGR